jgi:exopolysaccharide biosynthesis polyprenyl glycosylphosphotransferase
MKIGSPWRAQTEGKGTWLVPAGDFVALCPAAVVVETETSLAIAYAATTFLVLLLSGEYNHHWLVPCRQGLPRLLGRVSIPLFGLALVSLVLPVDGSALVQAPLSAASLVSARILTTGWIRRERRRGRQLRTTVVLGAGAIGADLARLLLEQPEHGLRPIGVIDDLATGTRDRPALPVLGALHDLPKILADAGISHVVVAFGLSADETLVKVLRSVILDGIDVVVVPRLFEIGFASARPELDSQLGIPIVHLRRGAASGKAFLAKRVFDVAVAVVALVTLAPLLTLIALAVKCCSPGPVLFKQRRVGQGGRHFDMLKFRTMKVNSDSDTLWSPSDRERTTKVGRVLRPLSLDELPQLWNVLVGEMSLVGPRPERPHFVDLFMPAVRGYSDRHRLPVGLTGLAQVRGLRGDTSIEDRVRLDNYYIEHWSAWHDLCILASTLGEVKRNALSSVRNRRNSCEDAEKVGLAKAHG